MSTILSVYSYQCHDYSVIDAVKTSLYTNNNKLTKTSGWWSDDKNLEPRDLFSLWSQVRARGCSYDGHWRFTWSLTSGLMGLVEVRASWPGHPH
jgi:hypothetical protein